MPDTGRDRFIDLVRVTSMAWAADNLNRGFYLWKINALPSWVLADGSVVPISPTINAGAAVIAGAPCFLAGRRPVRTTCASSRTSDTSAPVDAAGTGCGCSVAGTIGCEGRTYARITSPIPWPSP